MAPAVHRPGLTLGRRQIGGDGVALHQPVEGAPRDRIASVAREQHRPGRIGSLTKIGLERLGLLGLQRMRARVAALYTMDCETQPSEISVSSIRSTPTLLARKP